MDYVIMHNQIDDETDVPLFWNAGSKDWDWLSMATTFTVKERNTLALPDESWGWMLLPQHNPVSEAMENAGLLNWVKGQRE